MLRGLNFVTNTHKPSHERQLIKWDSISETYGEADKDGRKAKEDRTEVVRLEKEGFKSNL